jgi:glyoxylase-like metal-dependent hydrolase (beta-lactamase superfamily II)
MQLADAASTELGACQDGRIVELDGTIARLAEAFPPFQTDRSLRDGEVVEWGGRQLTFHQAPGHTPGTLNQNSWIEAISPRASLLCA